MSVKTTVTIVAQIANVRTYTDPSAVIAIQDMKVKTISVAQVFIYFAFFDFTLCRFGLYIKVNIYYK